MIRNRIKAVAPELSEAIDEADTDVKAVVVTEDGWAIVSNEGSRQVAIRMLNRAEFDDIREVLKC